MKTFYITLLLLSSFISYTAQEITDNDVKDIKEFLTKFEETVTAKDAFALKKMILLSPSSANRDGRDLRNKIIDDAINLNKNYSQKAIERVKNDLLFYFEIPNEEKYKHFDAFNNPKDSSFSEVKRTDFFMFDYKNKPSNIATSIVLLKIKDKIKNDTPLFYHKLS